MVDAGRILVLFGLVLLIVGAALTLFGRLHLPGDLTIKFGGATIYIPIATSIILSILLTIVLNVVFRQR